jgi:trans-2,3-dihydro-3-hydroxyanthranilate isomerase
MSRLDLEYALVDVFAERALEGNMLAVFTDARGLTADQMQALARETNLAETTFIFPSDDSTEVRVRIFTTQEELDFAGHPTLGTAAWLHLHDPRWKGAEAVTLRLNVGPITVCFERGDGPGVYGTMRQNDPVFGDTYSAADIAGVLGLHPADLDASCPAQTVSTGMAFCVVPIASLAALGRLEIPQAAAQRWLDAHGAKFFYNIARAGENRFQARMQFYNGEDPATGSGAGCATAWMVRHGWLPSGVAGVIEQGLAIRRPSQISVSATAKGDQISNVFVGGRTISVAAGKFFRS